MTKTSVCIKTATTDSFRRSPDSEVDAEVSEDVRFEVDDLFVVRFLVEFSRTSDVLDVVTERMCVQL